MPDEPNLAPFIKLMNECFFDESSFNQFVIGSFLSVKNQLQGSLSQQLSQLVLYAHTNRKIGNLLDKIRENFPDVYRESREKNVESFEKHEPDLIKIKYNKDKSIKDLISYCAALSSKKSLEELKKIYSSCRTEKASQIVNNTNQIITQLSNCIPDTSKGYSPLIEFVVKVKQKFPTLNENLENWLDQYGNFFGYDGITEELTPTSNSEPHLPVNSSESSLLIVIKKQEKRVDRLKIQAWLWASEEYIRSLFIKKKDSIEINIDFSDKNQYCQELSEVLTELIRDSNKIMADIGSESLRIDFFLPISLLSQEDFQLEFIDYQLGETRIKIGEKHPVVFRLKEILDDDYQASKKNWKDNWKELKKQKFNELIPLSMFENCNCTFKPNPSHTICLGYKKFSAADCKKALDYVVKRDIPILLWVRSSFNNEICIKEIQGIFKDLEKKDVPDKIQQLPLEIKEQRVAALDDEEISGNKEKEHIGHHICLLWNAPERMPPDPHKPENALMGI